MSEAAPGPLAGVTVVVTRPRSQAASLVAELEAADATARSIPVIEIVEPVDNGAALANEMASLVAGDWLVVTSPNGAQRVADRHAQHPLADGVQIAAVGPATKDRAEAGGLAVDLIPQTAIAEGLLDAFPPLPEGGATVLLARAEVARKTLPEDLARRGWNVVELAAYRTVLVDITDQQRVDCRDADAVIFTSGSTVEGLVGAVGVDGLPDVTVSIGPATTAVAERLGVTIGVEATEHTIAGAVRALAARLQP